MNIFEFFRYLFTWALNISSPKFWDEKFTITMGLHIEGKDFITLKKLVDEFELINWSVLVQAIIEFQFGDTKMLQYLTNVQQFKKLWKWKKKLVNVHTQVCII